MNCTLKALIHFPLNKKRGMWLSCYSHMRYKKSNQTANRCSENPLLFFFFGKLIWPVGLPVRTLSLAENLLPCTSAKLNSVVSPLHKSCLKKPWRFTGWPARNSYLSSYRSTRLPECSLLNKTVVRQLHGTIALNLIHPSHFWDQNKLHWREREKTQSKILSKQSRFGLFPH